MRVRAPHSIPVLQTSQEIEKVLLLRTGQAVVVVDHTIRLRVANRARGFWFVDTIGREHIEQLSVRDLLTVLVGGEEMRLDRLLEIGGTPVVKEK